MLDYFLPTFLDVVRYLALHDVTDLLLVAAECHVSFDEFLSAGAEVGMIEHIGRIASGFLFICLPDKELMDHDFST